jgi:hypothetical protein
MEWKGEIRERNAPLVRDTSDAPICGHTRLDASSRSNAPLAAAQKNTTIKSNPSSKDLAGIAQPARRHGRRRRRGGQRGRERTGGVREVRDRDRGAAVEHERREHRREEQQQDRPPEPPAAPHRRRCHGPRGHCPDSQIGGNEEPGGRWLSRWGGGYFWVDRGRGRRRGGGLIWASAASFRGRAVEME